MSTYSYEAVDVSGAPIEGTVDVPSQSEALRRIKEMGLFPTRVAERSPTHRGSAPGRTKRPKPSRGVSLTIPLVGKRVKSAVIAVFTRQLATLVEAGMPLLRGLRILQRQESHPTFKRVIGQLSADIESGGSLSESLARHPRVFNSLYVSLVKAGEVGGALETALRRLAEFMEKAEKIKGKVKSALFYPMAVLCVASCILILMNVFLIPQFKQLFQGLMPGQALPAFTTFVLGISQIVGQHLLITGFVLIILAVLFVAVRRTSTGRRTFDQLKLSMPAIGPVFRKLAIARFARTLGTLLSNGVPILQALAIVKETVGNVVIGSVVTSVQASVKEGETVAAPLRGSGVFPPVVVGMVDVGEQTGALPDMLLRIADNCDDEVDNAVNAMTSLLQPVLIVFLAIVVGSIVIALFLPIVRIMNQEAGANAGGGEN